MFLDTVPSMIKLMAVREESDNQENAAEREASGIGVRLECQSWSAALVSHSIHNRPEASVVKQASKDLLLENLRMSGSIMKAELRSPSAAVASAGVLLRKPRDHIPLTPIIGRDDKELPCFRARQRSRHDWTRQHRRIDGKLASRNKRTFAVGTTVNSFLERLKLFVICQNRLQCGQSSTCIRAMVATRCIFLRERHVLERPGLKHLCHVDIAIGLRRFDSGGRG